MRRFAFTILLITLLAKPISTVSAGTKELAITFDDLPSALVPTHADQLKVNQRILDILKKYQIKTIGFVIGFRVPGSTDIMDLWLKEGHDLGNHTYTHMDFDKVDSPAFEMDIKKGAFEIEKLLKNYQKTLTYFRFPYLHTGRNSERGNEIRNFLKENCYTIAPVTINPYDWEYNYQFVKAWGANDKKKQEQILGSYLARIINATVEAESLSWERFGRNIRQVLLLHLNRINAEVLDKILEFYFRSGYSFITLAEALEDPAYTPEGELVELKDLTWPVKPDLGLSRKQLK